MTFIELLQRLAQRLGQHQLPLNPEARQLRGLLDSSALHYELMTQIVRAIYARNDCHACTDPVTSDATFEALAPIRMEVLRSPRTDVDVFRLMEDLCVAIAVVFDRKKQKQAAATTPRIPADDPPAEGELITFPARRRVRL